MGKTTPHIPLPFRLPLLPSPHQLNQANRWYARQIEQRIVNHGKGPELPAEKLQAARSYENLMAKLARSPGQLKSARRAARARPLRCRKQSAVSTRNLGRISPLPMRYFANNSRKTWLRTPNWLSRGSETRALISATDSRKCSSTNSLGAWMPTRKCLRSRGGPLC